MEDVETMNTHVYVLVIVPTEKADALAVTRGAASSIAIPAAESTKISVTVVEGQDTKEYWQELTYYQHCGRLIQDKYRVYFVQILDKVDEFYDENEHPTPLICAQGSTGMGKSQLAIGLGGRRTYFYWLATPLESKSQSLYQNFSTISAAFLKLSRKITQQRRVNRKS